MHDGIVIYDDETIGHYITLESGQILIDFENDRYADNILELAHEHGATLSLLEDPDSST